MDTTDSRNFDLEIIRANYSSLDVTDIIRKLVTARYGLWFKPDDDLHALFGGDPNFGVLKELTIIYRYNGITRELRIGEICGRVAKVPPAIYNFAILNVLHGSGLSNQLYSIATGGLIAQRLCRRVPLSSLQISARVNVDDDLLDPKLKHHFSHLFDVPSLLVGPMPVFDDRKREVVTTNLVVTEGWRISSDEIPEKLQDSTQVMSIVGLLGIVRPSNIDDYQFMVGILQSCRPCTRLQNYVNLMTAILPTPYNVFHYRFGADWPTKEKASSDSEYFTRLYAENAPPDSKLPLYFCGAISTEEQRKIKHKHPYVYFKEDLIPTISKELGYEELAVIDRELAIGCNFFVGHPLSTFSLAVVLQRKNNSYKFYNGTGFTNNPYLLYCNGKPLW